MRKKGDALSTAWETINTPLVAADTAMKSKVEQEQKERKSLYLAVKRNSREREARRLASSMSVKMSNSKENIMSRIRGQSDTRTTKLIAREKRATHRHISSLMDDLPKDKASKGITVTKKTISMKPVSRVTKVKKPVTLCDLKKKAGINLFLKYREKEAAEKRAALWDKLLRSGKLGAASIEKLLRSSPKLRHSFSARRSISRLGEGVPQGDLSQAPQSTVRDYNNLTSIFKNLRKEFASPAKPVGTPMSKLKEQAKGMRKAKGKTAPSSRKTESDPLSLLAKPRKGPPNFNPMNLFKRSSDSQQADAKRFMLKIAADPNLSPREKLAMAGLIGKGLQMGAKALPKVMSWMGRGAKGAKGAARTVVAPGRSPYQIENARRAAAAAAKKPSHPLAAYKAAYPPKPPLPHPGGPYVQGGRRAAEAAAVAKRPGGELVQGGRRAAEAAAVAKRPGGELIQGGRRAAVAKRPGGELIQGGRRGSSPIKLPKPPLPRPGAAPKTIDPTAAWKRHAAGNVRNPG